MSSILYSVLFKTSHHLFRNQKPQVMEDLESNHSLNMNFSSSDGDYKDYNDTMEDMKLREYIKTLMTIGMASLL